MYLKLSHLSFVVFLSLTLGFHINLDRNRFNKVVIFGDSYSDTGNDYKLTNHTWPIIPPYYQGRFCNGTNWVDRLNVSKKASYAYGSATTDNHFVQGFTKLNTIPVPGVRQQSAIYLTNTHKNSITSKHTLYIIWGGINDVVFNRHVLPTMIVNSLINTIKDLLAVGAKNFLIFNQPPIQALPFIRKYNQDDVYNAFTRLDNNALLANLAALQQNNIKASIHMFNLHALITKIISNTSTIFTTTVHQMIADAMNPFFYHLDLKDMHLVVIFVLSNILI